MKKKEGKKPKETNKILARYFCESHLQFPVTISEKRFRYSGHDIKFGSNTSISSERPLRYEAILGSTFIKLFEENV